MMKSLSTFLYMLMIFWWQNSSTKETSRLKETLNGEFKMKDIGEENMILRINIMKIKKEVNYFCLHLVPQIKWWSGLKRNMLKSSTLICVTTLIYWLRNVLKPKKRTIWWRVLHMQTNLHISDLHAFSNFGGTY